LDLSDQIITIQGCLKNYAYALSISEFTKCNDHGKILCILGVSLVASLFSLAWAIASYTRAMRLSRPDKKPASGAALAFQALWRAGTLTARIISLALLALVSPTWMLTFLGKNIVIY
jgi:hypothetical protein